MKVKATCEKCNKKFVADTEDEHYTIEQEDKSGNIINELHSYFFKCPHCNHMNIKGAIYE